MTDRDIIELWEQAVAQGDDVYLATVVSVDGSSYRKPGARMLVTSSGKRAGTISGGCLEAEVAKKISWLTSNGSTVQKYHSSFDDDNEGVPYGLGCGGTIWILMESGEQAALTLRTIKHVINQRIPAVVFAALRGTEIGTAFVISPATRVITQALIDVEIEPELFDDASRVADTGIACHRGSTDAEGLPSHILMPILPPVRLHIFGAGDDAVPLVRFGVELGWQVSVWDGRSHLLRPDRFPSSVQLHLIAYRDAEEMGGQRALEIAGDLEGIHKDDVAVILTHSYAQDGALLQALLPKAIRYLGVLGPLHRTTRLLSDRAASLGMTVEDALKELHSPVGLDIGSYQPAVIALSIIAEMQAVLAGREVIITRPANS
jgi:xanthine dehydrogenase accessory factor